MSDSTIHARFNVTTKIAKATDKDFESNRFVLSKALLTPATRGGVFVTATDGKQMSIAHCEGETDGTYLIPEGALPTASKGGALTLNGQWETTTGVNVKKTTITPKVDPLCGRYPDAASIPQRVDTSTHDVLVLDADLLKKIADSIEADGELVTLFIPRADEKTRVMDKPIMVLGGTGFGVLMPGGIARKSDPVSQRVKNLNSFVSDYQSTFSRPTV